MVLRLVLLIQEVIKAIDPGSFMEFIHFFCSFKFRCSKADTLITKSGFICFLINFLVKF